MEKVNEELTNTKFVRLQNGDDLICELVELSDDEGVLYMIHNPLKIVYMQSKTGTVQLGFMPWVFPRLCAGQEFTIDPDDVLIISDVSEKMNKYYWENLEYYTNLYEEDKTESHETQDVEPEPEHEEDMEITREEVKEILDNLMKQKRTLH